MLVSPPMVFNGAGFQLGQHRLLGDKRHQYESDIRIPFIMRGKLGSTVWWPRPHDVTRHQLLSTQILVDATSGAAFNLVLRGQVPTCPSTRPSLARS